MKVLAELSLSGASLAGLENVATHVAVRLNDPQGASPSVYQSANWPGQSVSPRALSHLFHLSVGGRHWQLQCAPTPRYRTAARTWQPWAVLGTGLCLSVLLAAYLYGAAGREMTVNLLVRERTAELSRANQELKAEIAQRLEAEMRLDQERHLMEALMETTPDHIYFKDRESRFLRISRAQAERFKLPSPSAAVGKTDFDFFTAEHAQAAYKDEQQIMATGHPMVAREEKETWPDGSVSWVSTTKQCLRNPHGEPVGTFGISRDITAHKLAEEALARKTEELLRSNEELEQFAYVASHDLQEPLRMIASYTQLLARRYRGRLDQDADEFIGYAVDGAARMQTLINDLLAYSRVDRRGKPFAPTDAALALERALENLKVPLEDTRASIHHGPLPTVLADDVQLTQLFQNLVSNAIKFRHERPPEVHIGATLQPPPAGSQPETREWMFTVRDNGIGIEPEYFQRIFVIFQRLHTRDQYPGTGIGLAVCKKIVERHGGRIWVESQPGKGSTFFFTLPELKPAA
ncbi:MAG: PAS domain-containing protein [Verrucomicrobia bacterium]|nr:PAS domain-containing protein [Verrucomicrobiota bacterium]